jgi:hypothetical protein
MTIIKKAFDSYTLAHQSADFSYEISIGCFFAGSTMMGRIIFFKDNVPLPKNVSLDYGPEIHYPLSRYREIMTTLREENPLYIWLDTSTLVGSITTDKEAVGEEEGK